MAGARTGLMNNPHLPPIPATFTDDSKRPSAPKQAFVTPKAVVEPKPKVKPKRKK